MAGGTGGSQGSGGVGGTCRLGRGTRGAGARGGRCQPGWDCRGRGAEPRHGAVLLGSDRWAAEWRRAKEVRGEAQGRGARHALAAQPLTSRGLAVPTVSLPELRALLAAGRVRLIDVRAREEAAAGTIPGALNVPVSELEAALQMEPAAFRAAYAAEKPEPGEKNLVFFCQIGRRGALATQLAQRLGYRGARNYEGAYKEWAQESA